MEFVIKVNKWANFYFFIQNLSEWHFSNRKAYNALWRKELSPFSPEEENALKQFKEIRLKYKEVRSPFEGAFFLEDKPWSRLKTELPETDFKAIKLIFDLFQPKFDLLFEKELPFLKAWQEKLKQTLNDRNLLEPIILSLCSLYNVPKPLGRRITVYLLISEEKTSGGGANIDNASLTLEISRHPLETLNHAVALSWHELIHLYFEKHYFIPLLRQKFGEDRETVNLIKEVTASALFPKGLLAAKFLAIKDDGTLNVRIPETYTLKLLQLVSRYAESGKAFDEQYIKDAYQFVSDLRGIVK